MNAPFKQTEALGAPIASLGADVPVPLRLDGNDHLNDPLEYQAEALATYDDPDFDAPVGTIETGKSSRPKSSLQCRSATSASVRG